MKIIEHDWKWRHGLSRRSVTDAIVLHHAAIKTASAEDIHRAHLQRDNGTWAGIGYHLYIRKDGSIHRGRPLWASGAHVLNENWHTVGVCVEGNYDVETTMPAAQLNAVREALRYLKGIYPNAAIKCHRDMQATACPGRYYPLAEVLKYNAPVTPAESEDEDMTDEQVRKIVREMLDGANTAPDDWAKAEMREAIDLGITDGTRPKGYATRQEAAIMVLRAFKGGAAKAVKDAALALIEKIKGVM